MIVRPWLVRVWQSLKEALRDKERELEEADLKAKERKHNDKKVAMLSDRLKKAWEEAVGSAWQPSDEEVPCEPPDSMFSVSPHHPG